MKVSAFFLPLFLITGIQVQVQAATTRTSTEKANALTDNQPYNDATTLLERARAQAERENREVSDAAISSNLGLIYEKSKRFSDAENAYNRSIHILERIEGENSIDLVQPLCNLATLLYESGQFSRAESLLVRAIAITKSSGKHTAEAAMEMAILGKVYVIERKFLPAKEMAEKSLEIFASLGETEELGVSLGNAILGVVYAQFGQFHDAQTSLQRTIVILQHCLKPQDYRIGEAIANLGTLYLALGEVEKAESLFEQAHELFQSTAQNSLFVREFLASYVGVEHKTGHKKKAKELDKEAEILAALSPGATISRYVVDASALR